MQSYIDVKTVEFLTGEDRRRIWERVESGEYKARKKRGVRGANGECYLVEVSSLPKVAQLLYIQQSGEITGPIRDECDLAAYGQQFGDAGLGELLQRQRAAQQALAIRKLNPADVVPQLADLAEENGVSLRTLYRWMDAYEEKGLPGLMRAMKRKDKGSVLSLCRASQLFAYSEYMTERKVKKSTVYSDLLKRAAELGPDACLHCMFNEGTEAREQLMRSGEINQYPACADPDKQGMRVPECRQTLGRFLAAIPADEQCMAIKGKKAFKDDFMVMAVREKPKKVNEVWFGDHHQLDAFVVDMEGKPVRPWLTAWYDAATGCMVGWVLSTNPNTQTILEAFIKAVAHTMHSPFYGLPQWVYVDNGKDYRSKLFEMGEETEVGLGDLNGNIAECSVLQLLNINVTHALAYQGWAKPVERYFKTFEDIWLRKVPGWCGGSPKERPEDFSRKLRLQLERGQLWTMDQMYEYLQDTVFPEYHSREHSGYGNRKPIELYAALPRARDTQPGWEMLNAMRQSKARRKITQQGIRFNNELYWEDAMIGLAGKEVTVFYSESDLSTIGIVLDGHFLCEAVMHEKFRMVGEEQEKIAGHRAKQNGQIRDVKERILRASRNAFSDDVDPAKRSGNIMAIEYERMSRERARTRQEIKRRKQAEPEDDRMGALLEAEYERLMRNVR